MAQIEIKKFRKGQVIAENGAFELWMYQIKEGTVGLYDCYGTSEERFITQISAPEFFGEMGMMEAMPRYGTTVALTNVELYVINMDNLSEYFQNKPAKVVQILEGLCVKLRHALKYVIALCDLLSEYVELNQNNQPIPKELQDKVVKAVSFSKRHKSR